jgi:hypothetical protein
MASSHMTMTEHYRIFAPNNRRHTFLSGSPVQEVASGHKKELESYRKFAPKHHPRTCQYGNQAQVMALDRKLRSPAQAQH